MKDDGPAVALIDRLFELLDSPEHSHWHTMSLRGWLRDTELISFSAHLFVCGGVALRMWELLKHWPYRTARATHEFPRDERTSTNDALKAACPQCMDEMHAAVFKEWAFESESGEVGIADGELSESLHRIWNDFPVCNLQSEDRR